jgi:hypothetical protein
MELSTPAAATAQQVVGGEVCFRHSVRSAVQDVYSARAKLHEARRWPWMAAACPAAAVGLQHAV